MGGAGRRGGRALAPLLSNSSQERRLRFMTEHNDDHSEQVFPASNFVFG